MRAFTGLICLLAIALSFPASFAAGREGAERRSAQDSDELRTDMRQRRLKKVEDLDKHRLKPESSPTNKKAKPQTTPGN